MPPALCMCLKGISWLPVLAFKPLPSQSRRQRGIETRTRLSNSPAVIREAAEDQLCAGTCRRRSGTYQLKAE